MEMSIEVLISAMNLQDLSIAERAMRKTDVLIINQTDHEDYTEKLVEGHTIRMI